MDYIPTHIEKLSHPQTKRLLKGLGVKIKHGNHHVLHLTHEQHKKFVSNHKKGSGTIVHLSKHQAEIHGGDLLSDTRDFFNRVGQVLTPVAKQVGYRIKDELIDQAPRAIVKKGIEALGGGGLHKKKSKKEHKKKSKKSKKEDGGALTAAGGGLISDNVRHIF